MLSSEITLAFSVVVSLIFLSTIYLYFASKRDIDFLYTSLFFTCTLATFFGLFFLQQESSPQITLWWSRFQNIGVFGFIFTLPVFTSVILKRKLAKIYLISLGFITLVAFTLIIFSDLVIQKKIIYSRGLMRAAPGPFYYPMVALLVIICLYFYLRLVFSPKKDKYQSLNYKPVYIGIGIGILMGIINIIELLYNKIFVWFMTPPFVFGLFITSLCLAWTFLSQYSWLFCKLTESEQEINRLIEKSNRSSIEFVHMIAKTLDAKDHYTAGHSLRVMDYAVKIGRALNIPDCEIEILKQACLLHDIGKIAIPDGILNKKRKLTKKEREHIYKHPVVGKSILSTVSDFRKILDIILCHHERVDGNGYPNGRSREEIPLLARILAVADAYDAMRSERPYRKAKTHQQAANELSLAKGSQWDEEVVDIFLQTLSA